MDYLFFLQNLRETLMSWVSLLFLFISEFGVALSFLIPFVIYWCVDKNAGKKILFGYSFSLPLNDFIKNVACVYRPWIKDSRLHIYEGAKSTATGYSFPSGHTVGASSSFFGIWYWQKSRKVIAAFFFILPFFVAFSRNWLGAHTLIDVLVALLEGFLIVVFLGKFIEKFDKDGFDVIFLILSFVMIIILYLIVFLKSYPIDYLPNGSIAVDPQKMKYDFIKSTGIFLGFVISWVLERRVVKFEVPKSFYQKIIVGIIGIATIGLLLYVIFPFILSGCQKEIRGFIKYFLTLIWATFLYPLIFSRVLKK